MSRAEVDAFRISLAAKDCQGCYPSRKVSHQGTDRVCVCVCMYVFVWGPLRAYVCMHVCSSLHFRFVNVLPGNWLMSCTHFELSAGPQQQLDISPCISYTHVYMYIHVYIEIFLRTYVYVI